MKILVVEAAPLVRRTILNALESAFHQVVECEGGNQALEQLDKAKPDAVVIGSEVVGMSSDQLARQIRGRRDHQRTPLVLVSGRRSYEDVLKAVHCGVDEYIVLPFTGDLLLTKLDQALLRKAGSTSPLSPNASAGNGGSIDRWIDRTIDRLSD